MADRLLILGASARAAAASARRAGYEPVAIDLFADRDTKQICEAIRVPAEQYPEGLFRAARTMPKMPWMYTGGIENYPELVGELAKERELWGNGPEVLRKVRDPRFLASASFGLDVEYPKTVLPGGEAPGEVQWVRKPINSAGGRGVRFATEEDLADINEPDTDFVLQEYAPGEYASASYYGTKPIGFTRQLIGEHWLHAEPFGYCGSVCWICNLSGLEAVANGLPPLAGLWNADLAVHDNWCSLFEVNPRYTASTEVVEWTYSLSALNPSVQHQTSCKRIVGKAIYFAPASFTFPDSGPWDDSVAHAADVWRRPDFADVPHPGEVIEAGHPVITILTEADTEDACLARLKARAAELDRLFGFPTPAETDP